MTTITLPSAGTVFESLPRYLRRHKLMKAWMRITGEDPLQLVRIRGDAFGYADMGDGFLRLIVIDGDFEKYFFRIADALLERGGVFFDVGANHGLLSFGLAKKFGDAVQFHLFEPNPALVASIEKTRALYGGMNSVVNKVAVSDENGSIAFHIDRGQSGVSHISKTGTTVVTSIKLDDYIDAAQVRAVDLLKLDVEGYELPALRGAERALKNRTIRAVYFEYFEKNLVRVGPPRLLLDYLESLDFEVCLCRHCDFVDRGVPNLTLSRDLTGHGLPLLSVKGIHLPVMTDLLAVPREHLVAL